MSALARRIEEHPPSRAANDDCFNGGPRTRTKYVYDEAGHLLGEYNSTGALIQETIWLGDTPVATLRPGTPVGVFYVHADHLNTPRKVTRPSDNKARWTWESDPFGTATPNENPQALGTVKYNLRFPGQIFDSHAGLNYNYFRDYDAVTGRYIQSDPIGLNGGPNTYGYAGGNAVSNHDPLGLECISAGRVMRCIYPGGPDFRVPAPPGQPPFMGPNNFVNFFLYHRYDVQVPLDGADERCVMR